MLCGHEAEAFTDSRRRALGGVEEITALEQLFEREEIDLEHVEFDRLKGVAVAKGGGDKYIAWSRRTECLETGQELTPVPRRDLEVFEHAAQHAEVFIDAIWCTAHVEVDLVKDWTSGAEAQRHDASAGCA